MMLKITTTQGIVRYVSVDASVPIGQVFDRLDILFSGDKISMQFCQPHEAAGSAMHPEF